MPIWIFFYWNYPGGAQVVQCSPGPGRPRLHNYAGADWCSLCCSMGYWFGQDSFDLIFMNGALLWHIFSSKLIYTHFVPFFKNSISHPSSLSMFLLPCQKLYYESQHSPWSIRQTQAGWSDLPKGELLVPDLPYYTLCWLNDIIYF